MNDLPLDIENFASRFSLFRSLLVVKSKSTLGSYFFIRSLFFVFCYSFPYRYLLNPICKFFEFPSPFLGSHGVYILVRDI